MSATILPEKNLHYPVLLNEVINIITPQNGGTFIDCTFGQGGYSKKILEFPNTKVIAIDPGKSKCGLIKADIEEQKVYEAVVIKSNLLLGYIKKINQNENNLQFLIGNGTSSKIFIKDSHFLVLS